MRVLSVHVRLVRMSILRVSMLARWIVAREHIHLGGRQTAAAHFACFELRAHIQRSRRL